MNPKFSEIEKQKLVEKTREAAFNFVDDMLHMQDILRKSEPNSGDIRRLSAFLRRILIDEGGDLQKIAAPRLMRAPQIITADTKRLAEELELWTTYFASLGASRIFGGNSNIIDLRYSVSPLIKKERMIVHGKKGDPDAENITVKAETFLKQKILYFEKQWFTRIEILKYVANVAGGVHSGAPKDEKAQSINRMRKIGSYFRAEDGSMGLRLYRPPETIFEVENKINHFGVDFVFAQILATARYLNISPDIIELMQNISAEKDNNSEW